MRKGSAIAFVVGLFLVAALLAVGCGGNDDNGGGSATADGGGATAANVNSDGGSEGGDGGSEQTSQPSGSGDNETGISKKQFIRKAEAICYDVGGKQNVEISALAKNPNGDPRAIFEELTERADEVIPDIVAPSYREEIDRIRALGYPTGDEEEIEAMLAALEEVMQRAEANPDDFAQSNTVEGEPGNPFQRADDLARAYGFTVCPRV